MTKTRQEQEEGRYLRAGLPPWHSGITASYHLRKPPGGLWFCRVKDLLPRTITRPCLPRLGQRSQPESHSATKGSSLKLGCALWEAGFWETHLCSPTLTAPGVH